MAALLGPLQASAQSAVSPELRAALFEARDAVWRAYFEADSAKLVGLLPEQMVAMGQHRADIIRGAQGFKSGGGKFVGITFTDDELLVKGDMAVIWSRYRVETTRAGQPNIMTGKAIEIFVLENGKWVNPYWHLDEEP